MGSAVQVRIVVNGDELSDECDECEHEDCIAGMEMVGAGQDGCAEFHDGFVFRESFVEWSREAAA